MTALRVHLLGLKSAIPIAAELANILKYDDVRITEDLDGMASARELNECNMILLAWSKAAARDLTISQKITTAISHNQKFVTLLMDEQAVHPLLEHEPILRWQSVILDRNELLQAIGLTTRSSDHGPSLASSKKKYREKILEEFGSLRALGRERSVPIEHVFLPLKLRSNPADSPSARPCEVADLLETTRREILVVGGPGTGKTTLLRYLAYHSAGDGTKGIPIYIRIADLMKTNNEIEDFAANRLRGLIGKRYANALVEDDAFCRSLTILLLDGLDEISDVAAKEFMARLSSFRQPHPDCQLVMTSRPGGYSPVDIPSFHVFELEKLSDEDIENYIFKMCDSAHAATVWATVRDDARLLELAATPFILAMMCATPAALGKRTTQRATIYQECTRYLLRQNDWEPNTTGRAKVTEATAKTLETALTLIAVRFFKLDAKESFSRGELEFIISKMPDLRAIRPRQVLDLLVNVSGLLQRTGDEFYFVHRSIWEYFVAAGMRDEPVSNLLARANSYLWEEPIRMYVGLTPEREQEGLLKALWECNRGLALRAATELAHLPDELIGNLVLALHKQERLRLLSQLDENVHRVDEILEERRMILDTMTPMLIVEKDCEVLFQSFAFLERYANIRQCGECRGLVATKLDLKNASTRRRGFIAAPELRLEFVQVPEGAFDMGHDNRSEDEGPKHRVSLRSFWICKYPVTNALYYCAFPFAVDRREPRSNLPEQPATWVTWYEAMIFARWLGCDLATEAEWEYACRSGGQDDPELFDPTRLDKYAWFIANSGNRTRDVGQKHPNSWGIYDMLGNVREWCRDWFDRTYYQTCAEHGLVENPVGPENGSVRVLRGGCFDWNVANLAPTYRNYNLPDNSYFVNGFRLVFRGANPRE